MTSAFETLSPASVSETQQRMDDLHAGLVAELQTNSLVVGDVTLSSGKQAHYYMDVKRSLLRSRGARLVAELVGFRIRELRATAVGGLTMGADPVVSSTVTAFDGDLKGFYVRKEPKKHGLQRWIEGPKLDSSDRCLIVDDVVTTGGSIIDAIERARDDGLTVVGVLAVVDRLEGGEERIRRVTSAPYFSLAKIEDIYADWATPPGRRG